MAFKSVKLDESTKRVSINIGETKSKDEARRNLMVRDLEGNEESARETEKKTARECREKLGSVGCSGSKVNKMF